MKKWAIQDSAAPSEIARRLGRNKSTITRFLKNRSAPKRRGNEVAGACSCHALHMALDTPHACPCLGFTKCLSCDTAVCPRLS